MNVKSLAVQQLKSLARLIGARFHMRLRPQTASASPARLPVDRAKGGLVSGLDGLSNKAMLDAADRNG
ncbi:DUF2191 domain-containing protein [Variovorax guangxiensis]|uniref:DUF2191 domain-containing protein n=1 Tax=Variovorax guangxiensis TaxID=1775474 RepID=UPI00285DD817|nr:DUF2191 domain-containing protein [Variovorax guangxiensis]MDR6855265.1 hypothetical protein [Variovorax guangxiensis]